MLRHLRPKRALGFIVAGVVAREPNRVGFRVRVMVNVHPFLAVTHREARTRLLLKDGFTRHAIRIAAAEFKNGPYEYVFSTGGPVAGKRRIR